MIVENLIPNPWHSANPNDGREVPTHLKVLSALAYWQLKPPASKTRGFVEDASGMVEWQSLNSTAVVVGDMFNRFESAAATARTGARFVSPMVAPCEPQGWHRDRIKTVIAHPSQGNLGIVTNSLLAVT